MGETQTFYDKVIEYLIRTNQRDIYLQKVFNISNHALIVYGFVSNSKGDIFDGMIIYFDPTKYTFNPVHQEGFREPSIGILGPLKCFSFVKDLWYGDFDLDLPSEFSYALGFARQELEPRVL